MEAITNFFTSLELTIPVYLWIAGGLTLLLVILARVTRRHGYAVDLQYWQDRVDMKSRRYWMMGVPVIIASLLMIGVLAQPQLTTRPITKIYGHPVMLVVDISSSMGMSYSTDTPFGRSYEIFSDLISRRGDLNFGLMMFSSDIYIARYFINKDELFRDSLENRKEIAYLSIGTRVADALSEAREYMMEKIDGDDMAVILITDMDVSHGEARKIVTEINTMAIEGITTYIIAPGDSIEITQRRIASSSIEETTTFNSVAMDDIEGINRICEEIAETRLAMIREDEGLEKDSLMPYLVLPALGIVGLCLILSETRFQKIP
jgi:hypothetical protein